jgi:hypothetical protein
MVCHSKINTFVTAKMSRVKTAEMLTLVLKERVRFSGADLLAQDDVHALALVNAALNFGLP